VDSQRSINLRKLLQKFEILDDKRKILFEELTNTLNEILGRIFESYNNDPNSSYLVTGWRIGITRRRGSIQMPNGWVYPILGDCKIIVVIKELVDRKYGVKYDPGRPIPNYEESKKLEAEIAKALDKKIRPRGRSHRIEVYLFSEPNYSAEYAEGSFPQHFYYLFIRKCLFLFHATS
jgi:hypothetical protein